MYKEDLALNNLQGLICHKTQPNQINLCVYVDGYLLYLVVPQDQKGEGSHCKSN